MKISSLLCALAVLMVVQAASAAEPLKIGVIAEMSGTQAEYGLQITNGMKLYMQEYGDTVAGRKVELLIRDVGGANPDVSKRLAQELVTRDKVEILAGFGFTPNAMAAAPVATQAKIPMVVMNAASSAITTRSPYVVRTSMTIPQNAMVMADWAAKNGIKRVFILYADYGPGKDGAAQFKKTFTAAGGEIIDEVGVPLKNPEFAPYMQRLKDAKPDAAFLWVPSGELANNLFRSYRARGLDKAGIQMIGTSDAVDDMFLQAMGDAVIGTVTAGHYSVAHDSAKNKAFIKGYQDLFGTSMSPNFMAVGGYDGMAAIYEVIRKLDGKIDGDKAMEVFKGLQLESPRGPISIDPETRDIVQTIYIRRVERRGGELVNAEFAEMKDVKDPGK
jgi:branched-chain amino acid transport system substrate-binding protein